MKPTPEPPKSEKLPVKPVPVWKPAPAEGSILNRLPPLPTGDDFNKMPPLPEQVQLNIATQDGDTLLPLPPLPEEEESRAPGSSGKFPEIAGYQILAELGRGGMGVIYKARHLQSKQIMALKMILAGAWASPEELKRFLAEARTMAQLEHPNIVHLCEVDQHQNLPFFSLEYVGGGSLAQWLKQHGPFEPQAAAQLVEQVAWAMDYAHQCGVVHRDLKPENILLTPDGLPKVTDFGLVKRLEYAGSTELTKTGALMGTPSYMAPEQASGEAKRAGPAADIYALGAILFECLTGRPPFRGANTMETLVRVVREPATPPSRLRPGLPRKLDVICLKCLQKDPVARYAAARELAEDLRRFQSRHAKSSGFGQLFQKMVKGMQKLWKVN